MKSASFKQAIAAIDAANTADPNNETADGAPHPKERLYGQRMSTWLEKLRPDAPEALRIAARAQHIERWKRPRADYPMDLSGYLRWRKDLYKYHAERAAEILRDVGYNEETVDRVSFLLQKKRLTSDLDTASLEDAACLVFLQFHFDDFAAKTEEEKMINVIQKTWNKMTETAHGFALELNLSPEAARLVTKALKGEA
jgi:hypothetical protein